MGLRMTHTGSTAGKLMRLEVFDHTRYHGTTRPASDRNARGRDCCRLGGALWPSRPLGLGHGALVEHDGYRPVHPRVEGNELVVGGQGLQLLLGRRTHANDDSPRPQPCLVSRTRRSDALHDSLPPGLGKVKGHAKGLAWEDDLDTDPTFFIDTELGVRGLERRRETRGSRPRSGWWSAPWALTTAVSTSSPAREGSRGEALTRGTRSRGNGWRHVWESTEGVELIARSCPDGDLGTRWSPQNVVLRDESPLGRWPPRVRLRGTSSLTWRLVSS
mmetsp:Transcript_12823/g.37225  ORF Transcript_12823/g.37225 Transcript_12823/m.37225 type:complete len:274 (-) Transcript_12823:563-1384(-)